LKDMSCSPYVGIWALGLQNTWPVSLQDTSDLKL
jgi:hypothetical protein